MLAMMIALLCVILEALSRPKFKLLGPSKPLLSPPKFAKKRPGLNTSSPLSSKYKHRRTSALLRNIRNIRICMGKKTYRFRFGSKNKPPLDRPLVL